MLILYILYKFQGQGPDGKLGEQFNRVQSKLSKFGSSRITPHVTIHAINFNKDHPKIHQFFSFEKSTYTVRPAFRDAINEIYRRTLQNKLVLTHDNDFKQMGKYFALKYKCRHPSIITRFRMGLYRYISDKVGNIPSEYKMITRVSGQDPEKIDNYRVYSDIYNREVYAVQDYYHGVGVWTPHISLVTEDELTPDKKKPRVSCPNKIKFVKKSINTSVSLSNNII